MVEIIGINVSAARVHVGASGAEDVTVPFSETPDIEEMNDLLTRAICAAEFGEMSHEVVVSLAAACYTFVDSDDKVDQKHWMCGPKILDHLRQSLQQRGVLREMALNIFGDAVVIYDYTLDCAATGIADRIRNRLPSGRAKKER